MRGHEPILAMRKQGVKPRYVLVDEAGADVDWNKFNAIPNVEIKADERLERLDLRWAAGIDVRVSVMGVERAKDVFRAFQAALAKRVVCTACESVEINGRIEPIAVESMDTEGVIEWLR
jgi:hypothetical protein